MKAAVFALVALGVVGAGAWYAYSGTSDTEAPEWRFIETEPGFEEVNGDSGEEILAPEEAESDIPADVSVHGSLPPIPEPLRNGRTLWAAYWVDMTPLERAVYGSLPLHDETPRVGIQPGHWQLEAVPEELEGLKASSGARGGGYTEQATALEIAERVKKLLEAKGVAVDLLPATIPVDYVADAFVSIHADGATSASVNGFKIAGPRRDFSGKSQALVDALYASYGEATDLREDSNVTRRMSGYYAFNWRRYDHALHPMTPAAIVETGFMTSARDRAVIVAKPQLAAEGIANGILAFLGIEEE